MKTRLVSTPLKDLLIIEIDYFKDERGFFIETWHKKDFAEAGLDLKFVQDSHALIKKNTLKGLHFQGPPAPMGKLIRSVRGRIFKVAVDIRVNSRTFGKWYSTILSARNKKVLYIPPGFALGSYHFTEAELLYKQTAFYTPSAEGVIAWNDRDIGIKWPKARNPIISKKDKKGISLKHYLEKPAFK